MKILMSAFVALSAGNFITPQFLYACSAKSQSSCSPSIPDKSQKPPGREVPPRTEPQPAEKKQIEGQGRRLPSEKSTDEERQQIERTTVTELRLERLASEKIPSSINSAPEIVPVPVLSQALASLEETEIACSAESSVNFDFDSARITTEDRARLSEELSRHRLPDNVSKVIFTGYTDPQGSASYNRGLGAKRAVTLAELVFSEANFSGISESAEIEISLVSRGKQESRNTHAESRRAIVKVSGTCLRNKDGTEVQLSALQERGGD